MIVVMVFAFLFFRLGWCFRVADVVSNLVYPKIERAIDEKISSNIMFVESLGHDSMTTTASYGFLNKAADFYADKTAKIKKDIQIEVNDKAGLIIKATAYCLIWILVFLVFSAGVIYLVWVIAKAPFSSMFEFKKIE
jgi:hypothetical protein